MILILNRRICLHTHIKYAPFLLFNIEFYLGISLPLPIFLFSIHSSDVWFFQLEQLENLYNFFAFFSLLLLLLFYTFRFVVFYLFVFYFEIKLCIWSITKVIVVHVKWFRIPTYILLLWDIFSINEIFMVCVYVFMPYNLYQMCDCDNKI